MEPEKTNFTTIPSNHSEIAMAIAMRPPRRRIARRVANNPPGITGHERRGEGTDAGMGQSYDPSTRATGHLSSPSLMITLAAAVMWLMTILGEHVSEVAHLRPLALIVGLVTGAVVFSGRQERVSIGFFIICGIVGLVGGSSAWNGVDELASVPCSGDAIVRTDPMQIGNAVISVLEIENIRYRAITHGRLAWRLKERMAGEHVFVVGDCGPSVGRYQRFDHVNHIRGRIVLYEVSEKFSDGSLYMRAANRTRKTMIRGVRHMPDQLRALFTGLVIGDDREQSREMVNEFRASGLSHLCAVSGQNVAYLLAVMSPLLGRLRRVPRWCVTLFLLLWFVALARGEPSVLRAAFMAGVVATNSLRGKPMNARSVIALTAMMLLVVDPLLAWSIGFALSVGATLGLAWLSHPLQKIVGSRGGMASTIAALVGTMPVSFAVFGHVPVVSLIANPLSLAVAGAVMMIGLPLAILGGIWSPLAVVVSWLMVPPVAWVAGVAAVCSQISPTGWWNLCGWLVVVGVIAVRMRNSANRPTSVAG